MRLDIATLADAATVRHGQLNILGTLDRIVAPSFPLTAPTLTLVLRVVGTAKDVGQHQLEVQFLDADRKPVLGPEGKPILLPMPFQMTANPMGAWHESTVPIVIHLNGLPIPAPDSYAFALLIDGELMGEVRLFATLNGPQTEESGPPNTATKPRG